MPILQSDIQIFKLMLGLGLGLGFGFDDRNFAFSQRQLLELELSGSQATGSCSSSSYLVPKQQVVARAIRFPTNRQLLELKLSGNCLYPFGYHINLIHMYVCHYSCNNM